MFIPKWALVLFGVIFVGIAGWSFLLATGRNPLPFPDPGSRIFTASSVDAKNAVVALLGENGLNERLKADSGGVSRSIMMDGTIINHSPPAIVQKVGGATACIGLVSNDPPAAAAAAVAFLRARGFAADAVLDVEPGLPVAFVLTDALSGSCINFRPHVIRMMRGR